MQFCVLLFTKSFNYYFAGNLICHLYMISIVDAKSGSTLLYNISDMIELKGFSKIFQDVRI